MSRSLTRVQNTVPLAGPLKMQVYEMDIDNYDSDNNSDGEAFAPSDVGWRRFVAVIPFVVGPGSANTGFEGARAMWDEAANAIRLHHSAGSDGEMAEMSSNANEGALVKLVVIGV